MKANELMIGDWITSKKWTEKTFKLTRINDSGKFFYGITVDGSLIGPFFIEELEPISLTPEILEKNGFEFNWRWRLKGHDLWLSQSGDEYRVYVNEDDDKRDNFCWIKFVHELQQVIRLCGIEKEIVI